MITGSDKSQLQNRIQTAAIERSKRNAKSQLFGVCEKL